MFKAYDSELMKLSEEFKNNTFLFSDYSTCFIDKFNNTINEIDKKCSPTVKNTEQEILYTELMNYYILKVRTKIIEVAHADNKNVSWFITGRSGINVKKYNENSEKAIDKNLDFLKYIDHIAEKIKRKIRSLDKENVERKQRIADKKKETFEYKEETYPNFKLIVNPEIARIQLVFEGKPEDEIRTKLKKYAFRWSPKSKVWQRILTHNALFATKVLIKELEKL